MPEGYQSRRMLTKLLLSAPLSVTISSQLTSPTLRQFPKLSLSADYHCSAAYANSYFLLQALPSSLFTKKTRNAASLHLAATQIVTRPHATHFVRQRCFVSKFLRYFATFFCVAGVISRCFPSIFRYAFAISSKSPYMPILMLFDCLAVFLLHLLARNM